MELGPVLIRKRPVTADGAVLAEQNGKERESGLDRACCCNARVLQSLSPHTCTHRACIEPMLRRCSGSVMRISPSTRWWRAATSPLEFVRQSQHESVTLWRKLDRCTDPLCATSRPLLPCLCLSSHPPRTTHLLSFCLPASSHLYIHRKHGQGYCYRRRWWYWPASFAAAQAIFARHRSRPLRCVSACLFSSSFTAARCLTSLLFTPSLTIRDVSSFPANSSSSLTTTSVNAPGVAADLSHINTPSIVTGYLPADGGLGKALKNADIVVIPAGVPRKPGMTRDDLFNVST